MTAISDTWKVPDVNEWALLAPFDTPCATSEIDTNFRTIDSLPALGGNASHYEGPGKLTDVRLEPPPMGTHRFHQLREGDAERGMAAIGPLNKPEKRRGQRGKSRVRYGEFRKNTDRPVVSKGQYRNSDRGRHRSRTKRGDKSP